MHWHWADSGEKELILIDSTEDERASAERGIAEIRMAGKKGEATGSRLHQAVESGHLPWELVRKLSAWCNTEGIYASGVGPAHAVSQALFNQGVLPRLTAFRGDGLTDAIAHHLFAEFAEIAGIFADRTLVREQSGPQSVAETAIRTTVQTNPAITYKRRPVSDYSSLVHTYSDKDLASPSRSTIPLLAY